MERETEGCECDGLRVDEEEGRMYDTSKRYHVASIVIDEKEGLKYGDEVAYTDDREEALYKARVACAETELGADAFELKRNSDGGFVWVLIES